MIGTHRLDLPCPRRGQGTTSICACGYTLTYHWGQLDWATNRAEEHIRAVDHCPPTIIERGDGSRYIIPGALA